MDVSSVNFLTHVHCNQVEQENETPSSSVQEIAKRTLKQETEKACGKRKKIRAKKKKKTPVTEPWKSRDNAEKAGFERHYVDISVFPQEIQERLRFTSSTSLSVIEVLYIEIMSSFHIIINNLKNYDSIFFEIGENVKKLKDFVIANEEKKVNYYLEQLEKYLVKLKDINIDQNLSYDEIINITKDSNYTDIEKSNIMSRFIVNELINDEFDKFFLLMEQIVNSLKSKEIPLKNWTCLTAQVIRSSNSKNNYPSLKEIADRLSDRIITIIYLYEIDFFAIAKKDKSLFNSINKFIETKFDDKRLSLYYHVSKIGYSLFLSDLEDFKERLGNLYYADTYLILDYIRNNGARLELCNQVLNKKETIGFLNYFNEVVTSLFELFALLGESACKENPCFQRGSTFNNIDGLKKNSSRIREDAEKLDKLAAALQIDIQDKDKLCFFLDEFDRKIELMRNINIDSYGGYARMLDCVRVMSNLKLQFDTNYKKLSEAIFDSKPSEESMRIELKKLRESLANNYSKFTDFLSELEVLFGISLDVIQKYFNEKAKEEVPVASENASFTHTGESNSASNDENIQEAPAIEESRYLQEALSKVEEPQNEEKTSLVKEREELKEKKNEKAEAEVDNQSSVLATRPAFPKTEQKEKVHNVKAKNLLKRLSKTGWKFLRQKGSHQQFSHPQFPHLGLATVPFHSGRATLSPGIVQSVLEQVQRSRELEEE